MPDDSDRKVTAAGPQTEVQNLYKLYITSKLVPISADGQNFHNTKSKNFYP